MKRIMAAFIAALLSIAIADADTSIPSYDATTRTLRIPAVAFNGTVLTGLQLSLGNDSQFSVTGLGTSLPAGSPVPPNAAFFFPQNLKAVIPKVTAGADTYSNLILSLTNGGKLSPLSLDGPTTGVSNTSSTNVVRMNSLITVPADMSLIVYPDSYTSSKTATVDLVDPDCDLAPSTISFPASYVGSFPLPVANGAPFPSSVKFGVSMKDGWNITNPSMNTGCGGNVRTSFLRTVTRLKTIGANYIELTPWTLFDPSKSVWEVAKPGPSLNPFIMSDTDLEWAVGIAHSYGLQVRWRNQIQGTVDFTIPPGTLENVTKFMAAYEPYMLERAATLQRIGVDDMMVGCICWFYPNGDNEDFFVTKLGELVPKIKTIFSGKLSIWMWTPKIYSNSTLIKALDRVELYLLNPPLSQSELSNLTVPLLKSKFASMINGLNNSIGNSKQIMWTLGAPSRANYFTSGYYEETGCTSGTNVISQTGSDCIQRDVVTDFSFQAMVNEALLEAIREQTFFDTYSVATDGYWLTDSVIPASSFPNIAVSIRNKPAEALMRQWFTR